MKKILILLFPVLVTGMAKAQIVTSEPADFSAVEPVTITVDVSGTRVAGFEPLYIWAWIELGDEDIDSPTNGDFSNSNEFQRMTKVADNIWSYTFTSLRDFYQQPPGVIGDQIGFLIKPDDGSVQTGDSFLAVEPPRFVDADFRTFPSSFAEDDIVTVIYNQSLDPDDVTNGLSEYFLYATATLGDGTVVEPVAPSEVGSTPSLQLQPGEGGIFTLTLIPERFFELTEDQDISSISFVIRSRDDENVALSPRIRNPLTLK